jgi:hypothetical protein
VPSVETYLEKYLQELQEIRSSGQATAETSYRRIAALCLMQPRLNANYTAVKADTYPWPEKIQ